MRKIMFVLSLLALFILSLSVYNIIVFHQQQAISDELFTKYEKLRSEIPEENVAAREALNDEFKKESAPLNEKTQLEKTLFSSIIFLSKILSFGILFVFLLLLFKSTIQKKNKFFLLFCLFPFIFKPFNDASYRIYNVELSSFEFFSTYLCILVFVLLSEKTKLFYFLIGLAPFAFAPEIIERYQIAFVGIAPLF